MRRHVEPPRRSRQRVGDLERHVGHWLRLVANHVSGALARRLEEHGCTVAEWVALRWLFDRPAATNTALVAALGMTKGAVTKVVDRLVDKRLVARRVDVADRRVARLAPTRAGRALVPKLAALADANDEHFFGQLRAAERRALIGTLRRIVDRLALTGMPNE